MRKNRQAGFTMLELIIVVAMALVIVAFAVPNYQRAMRNFRLMGDARAINGQILLAKMRAASNFTRARVRFNLSTGRYFSELWCQAAGTPRVCTAANVWQPVSVSSPTPLSATISYGVATQINPPVGTQGGTLAQPGVCRAGITSASTAITNTYCIIFNSRGYPVDADGTMYSNYGIYITDGSSVQGITVSATGLTSSWRHDAQDTLAASWYRH